MYLSLRTACFGLNTSSPGLFRVSYTPDDGVLRPKHVVLYNKYIKGMIHKIQDIQHIGMPQYTV
jgi:hypothetical protein